MRSCEKQAEAVRLSLSAEELHSGCGFVHQFSIRETFSLHTHDFYEFFLISKGKGIHRINGSFTLLSEGSFVLIRPSDEHCYDFLNQYDLELINIPFLPTYFERVCRLLDCTPAQFDRTVLCPQVELAEPLLSEIREKLLRVGETEAGTARKQYLSSVLPFFLYQFLPLLTVEEARPFPDWLSRVLTQMEEPENFIEGLPRLIKLSGVTQEYLTRSFQKYLHLSPTEYINIRRMELAASLLLQKKLPIIEVCQECGFRNLSYFYREFGRQYGCSPGKFAENAGKRTG